MKFLLSTGIGYRTHTLQELEDLVLSEGYDGLEINMPPRHLSPEETSRDTDYSVISSAKVIHAPGDLYDKRRFESALKDALQIAGEINVPLVNIHPPALSVGGRTNVEAGIELIKELNGRSGIDITYEILVNPYGLTKDRQAYFLEQQSYNSVDDYLSDVKKHNLFATLDTAHLGAWQVDPVEFISVLGDNLKHVHISDYSSVKQREHLLLGEGDVNLSNFLRELNKVKPELTVTVELHPPGTRQEVEAAIKGSMEYIKLALS